MVSFITILHFLVELKKLLYFELCSFELNITFALITLFGTIEKITFFRILFFGIEYNICTNPTLILRIIPFT